MRKGFTLFELALVILVIGILSAFAVPKFRRTVERSKAQEAFDYLSTIRSAYEKYHIRQKSYTQNIAELEINTPMPQYFELETPYGDQNSWSVTLKRKSPHSGYGNYTVTFSEKGFDAQNSTIADKINPVVQ